MVEGGDSSKAKPGSTKTPSEFLKAIKGRPVGVKLSSGVDYRGVLACLDGYMNIAMEQTEEYVDGQLKNKYGDAFLRGNNGTVGGVVIDRSLAKRGRIEYFDGE